ncbi:MAG: P-loop NTPase [Thermoplasmatota archaeon]
MSELPMAGQQAGGPADPRAAERLKRRVRIINNMKRIKHKFIVASGKGGVGKSTVASNLAAVLAAQGHTVGLLDMDLTGPNIPTMFGIKESGVKESEEGGLIPIAVNENLRVMSMQFLLPEGDQAVVWRGPIKMQVIGQFLGDVAWGDMDYLIVDLPPGSSDEPLSVAQNIPDADGMILVTTPQEVAVGDVRKSVNFANKLQMPVLGVIENMSGLMVEGHTDPGATVELDTGVETVQATADGDGKFSVNLQIFEMGGGEAMAKAMNVPFLGRIPMDLRVNRAGDAGSPIAVAESDSPAKTAIAGIIAKLTEGHKLSGEQ